MSNCPKCNSPDTAVKDSRPSAHFNTIITRRRRICLSCTERFTTYEISHEALKTGGFDIDSPNSLEKAAKVERLLNEIKGVLA